MALRRINASLEPYKIDFKVALIARRYSERKDGFDTFKELEEMGVAYETIEIKCIEGDFMNSKEWEGRINNILKLINS